MSVKQIHWITLLALIVLVGLGACNTPSVALTGSTPTAIATTTPPSAFVVATPAITETITETPIIAPTIAATETLTVTETVTGTRRATATRPRFTATPKPPASVFVSAIKIDPTPVKSNQSPVFTVTFENNTGAAQSFRWFVKVYQQDQPQSFGETSKVDNLIAPKSSKLTAPTNWKTLVVAPECMFFIARVFWVDENNQVIEFMKPNGSSPATGFNVCPA